MAMIDFRLKFFVHCWISVRCQSPTLLMWRRHLRPSFGMMCYHCWDPSNLRLYSMGHPVRSKHTLQYYSTSTGDRTVSKLRYNTIHDTLRERRTQQNGKTTAFDATALPPSDPLLY